MIHEFADTLKPSGNCLQITRQVPQPVSDRADFGDAIDIVLLGSKKFEVECCIGFEGVCLWNSVDASECSRTPLESQQ
jgi:hypothetical protein